MTSEAKVKKALAQLDTAVQAWYAEHNPENAMRYASVGIFDDPDIGHSSRITLNSDPAGDIFVDMVSSKHTGAQ